MPFTYDPITGLFVSAWGPSVRALTVNKPDRTAKIVQLYRGHNDVVNDLVVTFHVLLSASDEVICHNLGTGREKWRLLKFCNKRVMALSVLGDTLVCCMEDCSVAMINIRRGSLLYFVELKGERAGGVPFIGVDAFNRLAYVQGNRSVNGWSMVIGRRVFNTDLVLGQIYSSAHSAVYKILFGGAADGAVRAYKIPTGETLWTALGHTENVNALIASEFLEFVISASADGSMRAWDIRNGTPRWSTLVFPDKSAITAAACAEWEKKIVAAGENGSLVCLDASDGRELWRTTPQPFGFLSLKIQAATDFSGVFARFNLGHMLMTEDHEGVITVRDLKTGRQRWSWEAPLVYSRLMNVAAASSPSGGRRCFAGIRSIVGRYEDGIVRAVNAHNGSTLWRTSGGGGLAISMVLENVRGQGVVAYGTDTGSLVALDEMTGKRLWKIAGFGGAVVHVVSSKLCRIVGRKTGEVTNTLLTWSDDNVLRMWNLAQGIRLWSRHNVDASVGVFASPGCPFVVCVGLFHVTTLQMETGHIVNEALNVGDAESPIVHAIMNPRVALSRAARSSARKLSSRGSFRSSSVFPVDEEPPVADEEKAAIQVLAQDDTSVPSLDLSSLPAASPKRSKAPPRAAMVACILKNGDVFVVDAEDGDIPCAVSFPWTEDGDGSVGRTRPVFQEPQVALYEGFGVDGASRKPLVIAALGHGDDAFLVSWRVFDDNRNTWELNFPTYGKTFIQCVGKRLYYTTYEGLTIMDPVTSRIIWQFNGNREYMSSAQLLLKADPPKLRRSGWTTPDETVKGIVFGSRPGGMFALSTERRESRLGELVFLQLGSSDELDVFQDEIPSHPSYHPPGSGGLSGLLRMSRDAALWNTHKWIHTTATKLHEALPTIDFVLEAVLWVLVVFQMTYFPLRAQFPPIMLPWQATATSFMTFDISRMDGTDPFEPAYLTSFVLFAVLWVLATTQTWIWEWHVHAPESLFRNGVVLLVRLFVRFSYMLLFLPVMRMLIAPYICNVQVQKVAYQMMGSQDLFLDPFAPNFYIPTLPSATAVSMGRDLVCKGGKYFTFFAISIILLLLYLPLICRLIATRGDLTLLRYSTMFRSAIGWWRDDDSAYALDVVKGRVHGFTLKNRYVGLFFLVFLRTVLIALAEAGLPPAAEFFLVLAVTVFTHFILMVRPPFHDKIANVLVKSLSAVVVLLSFLAWFSSVYIRPIGPRGIARDAFITFLIVVGIPGVFVSMLLEEEIKARLAKHMSCCHRQPAGPAQRDKSSRKSFVSSRDGDETEHTEHTEPTGTEAPPTGANTSTADREVAP